MAIYKDTKRNTWYFRIYVTNSNGKKVQKCRSGFKTKTEAKIAETTYLNNSRLNILNLSFEELYTIYIQDKTQKLKYQSIRTIKNRFENHILPYFKDYNIKDITHKEYIEWKEKIIKKEYSYKYNTSLHICMVGIFNYAISFYGLNVNIASKVGNFSKKDYIEKTNFWTYEEFEKFINVIEDKLDYALFTTLYYTGMRLGECLALKWTDFNVNSIKITKTLVKGKKNNEYMFNTPKTSTSIRDIKLDENTAKILNGLKLYYSNFIEFNENWFIFGGLFPLSTTTIERKKNKYCKLANVKQIRIHDFRHSHATLLLSNGLPVTVISKRLGHADTSMTLKTYSHLIPEDENKAINLLNQLQKKIK